MTDERTIFAEIEAVLADRDEIRLDRLEHTLTSGYAAALALEAERWRIERRIAEAAALVRGRTDGDRAAEIALLARSLSSADADLERLRDLLATLRKRATAARAAAA
jgi:hypothetical protein